MELYCHIGGADNGGNQSYSDALARAKSTLVGHIVNPDTD
jgi:hypothetical protein